MQEIAKLCARTVCLPFRFVSVTNFALHSKCKTLACVAKTENGISDRIDEIENVKEDGMSLSESNLALKVSFPLPQCIYRANLIFCSILITNRNVKR